MKSIDAIYKFGNLYDKATKRRIIINDGAEVSITLQSSNDLLSEDPKLPQKAPLNAKEKEDAVIAFCQKQQEQTKYWKLFKKGKHLYFEISASVKSRDGMEPFHYIFELELLEDLYIYNKRNEPKYARFIDCACQVQKCSPQFEFFEPMMATSLNDAYTKTFELYFAMCGKSTCNAFDRFAESDTLPLRPIRKKTEDIQKEN